MRYIVNIDPITNLLSDKNFFFGTGFMGAEFSTKKELLQLLREYATIEKDGVRYWREYIKLSFSLASTISSIKEEGNRQARENGVVNLFTTCLAAKKDPFYGIHIYFRPAGWLDENGNVFKFVVEKGEELTPNYGKLSNILEELGIEIEQ